MNSITVSSPAKINLLLEIISKRSDGYHNINTIFQKISLCDEITISVIDNPGIIIKCNYPDIPTDSGNLVYKASEIILKKFGISEGLLIDIKKKIPVGAGLGGGSSNAAATLSGLNKIFGFNLPTSELIEMGKNLGADVPFFVLQSGTAKASGTGEELIPLKMSITTWFAVIFPGFGVSTAWAYKTYSSKYKLLTKKEKTTILNNSIDNIRYLVSFLYNDFEDIVIKNHPEIGEIKQKLAETGAKGALMSGSGSSVFGVFETEKEAIKSVEVILSDNSKWRGFIARSI